MFPLGRTSIVEKKMMKKMKKSQQPKNDSKHNNNNKTVFFSLSQEKCEQESHDIFGTPDNVMYKNMMSCTN
jgi:hypothetical protein